MYRTKQENFWGGEFGNDYSIRNQGGHFLASNLALFSRICAGKSIRSIFEFGANMGNNLEALRLLLPKVTLSAIEINHAAAQALNAKRLCKEVIEGSILDFTSAEQYDMVLIKGVLIHIAPEMLPCVYEKLYSTSCKYICIAEYYNPTPMQIAYRGHDGFLFKRDFAGELLAQYPDLELIDYGFVYHRDKTFPQDDLTWFLLAKAEV